MALQRATTTFVAYNPQTLRIVAEVYPGNRYYFAPGILIYNGTLDDFIRVYPEYSFY